MEVCRERWPLCYKNTTVMLSCICDIFVFLYYRYLHEPNSPKKKITRKREFEDSIREENIEMPTQLPPEVERKSIQERIQVWSLSTLCTCDWIYAKYSWSCNSFIFVNFYPCWIITSIKCWTCNFCHNC